MLQLIKVKRTYPDLLIDMANHYSKPKGFVGRNICYAVIYNNVYYGAIVGGSATKFLPGRNQFFNWNAPKWQLWNIVNNIFFHIEKIDGKYPIRNFSQVVLNEFKTKIKTDWFDNYGDEVLGFETLIELPRTGELYLRNGFQITGTTKGFTCKRTGGIGTDSWSGKRVWDTENLRPKLVLCQKA